MIFPLVARRQRGLVALKRGGRGRHEMNDDPGDGAFAGGAKTQQNGAEKPSDRVHSQEPHRMPHTGAPTGNGQTKPRWATKFSVMAREIAVSTSEDGALIVEKMG